MISYNTAVVLLGTGLLGANAGLVGSFAVLRQRSLLGDALAHAALPGLCLAFLLVGQRSLPAMQLGALLTGILGVAIVAALRRGTRIKEDAAIGIVLSVFFGLGIVLVRLIQNQTATGSKAGLDSYIYGKTAGMLASDVYFIAAISLGCLITVVLLFKEFRIVSFDPAFARVQGLPTFWLDLLLMSLISLTVVIGLPAVGVVMVAALLILPAAAARFWTEKLGSMVVLASLLGATIGLGGTSISALNSALPTGPVIVLVGTVAFLISVLFAPSRGALARVARQVELRRRIAEQRSLRTLHKVEQHRSGAWTVDDLMHASELGRLQATRLLRRARHAGWITPSDATHWKCTDRGAVLAANADRAYRVWRLLLNEYPDQVSQALDLDFVTAEQRLPPELQQELSARLQSTEELAP